MYSNAKITLNGKSYFVEQKDGKIFVDGKPKLQWIRDLDEQSKDDLNALGMKIISGKITKNFQTVVNDFHRIRNN